MQDSVHAGIVPNVEERGINILDIIFMFTVRWRLIVLLTLSLALLGFIGASIRTKKYTARVTFTVQSDQSGGAVPLILQRAQDPTIALLKSNSVADYVVQDSNLKSFRDGLPSHIKDIRLYYRGLVKSEAKVEDTGDGVYSVEIEDPYPERGVAIANSFLAALQDMSFRMNAETAVTTRRFFESQVADARQQLDAAEQELRDAQARTGLLQPGSQTGLELGQISALRAQLAELQVQRATLAESSTAENPGMVRLGAQIAETQAHINALTAKTKSNNEEGIPTQNLELSRLERRVQEQQAIVTSMVSQFERAQMQERFTAPKVRTVDRAELPLPPASRKRILLTVAGMVLGLLLGAFVVIVSEMRRLLLSRPDNAERLLRIRSSLAWRHG